MDDSQILEFLLSFRQGEVWKRIQVRTFQEKETDEETIRSPGKKLEEYAYSQGRINGLEYDPVEALIEELKQKLKEPNE